MSPSYCSPPASLLRDRVAEGDRQGYQRPSTRHAYAATAVVERIMSQKAWAMAGSN